MTEHKFTDEEVIRALECCNECNCGQCPCYVEDINVCREIPIDKILGVINRQRAEIEKLTVEIDAMRGAANTYKMHYVNAMQEIERQKEYNTGVAFKHYFDGIKDYAERLKEKMNDLSRMEYGGRPYFLVSKFFIDQTVKELTEGKPCTDGADCSTCEHCYHDGGYNECAVDGIKPN